MLRFGVEGGGGGGVLVGDDVEKVSRTSGKILATPLLNPEKQQESWETSLSSVRGRTFKEALIKNHSWRNENFS